MVTRDVPWEFELPSVSVLVDLLDVQGSLRAVRVPDLEVDGGEGAGAGPGIKAEAEPNLGVSEAAGA